MKLLSLAPVAILISGCLATKKGGTSYLDSFDAIKVDEMVGNNVSSRPLQRTIVCLNGRRETRRITSVTNVTISFVTNATVNYITNLTITAITNQSRTLSTNAQAQAALPQREESEETGTAQAETNAIVTLAAVVPPNSTNDTITTANNVTLSKAPNQLSTTANFQLLQNRQVTVNNTNLSITTADHQTVSIETNAVVTSVTNFALVPVTNVNVIYTNILARDYYVYTEFTPPPDFTLASGESLVLLIDGMRHGLTATNSQTLFLSRKGFQSTLYRVPPELLTDIANAREVKLRLKGSNSVIERDLSAASRAKFHNFLLRYFAPEGISSQANES